MQDISQFVTELQEEFPGMTENSAKRLIGYVLKQWLNVLGIDELTEDYFSWFMTVVIGLVEINGMMSYDSYSENGLSAIIDKKFVTHGLVPKAKVVR